MLLRDVRTSSISGRRIKKVRESVRERKEIPVWRRLTRESRFPVGKGLIEVFHARKRKRNFLHALFSSSET